ncbi:hypothetical protein V6N11_071599 [Hibiscus sabdariffa]|uniref:Uncharacterized protein n=1 Tax=Hibiscus sabdariffa TaxID=183260 RepID=A0ABR2U194_9ROSI
MQGAEGLAATAWLALRFVRAACWVGYLAIIGMMAGTTDAPGFTSFRPITVVAVAAGRLAWLPSFFFAWCASMPLPMLRSLCFRPTLVLTADFVSSVRLVVGPVHWPAFRLVVAAIHADWSRGGCWACPGPWFALLPLLDYGASAPMVRFVPMAVVGCLHGGYSMVGRLVLPLALTLDLFTECRILYWNVPSARPCERVLSCFPSRRVLSCFPSHPFWAGYGYLCSNLCRASTSIRIDLHPYLYSHCRRHLYYALTSSCKSLSFVVCPIALAKMGPSPLASPPKSGLSKSAPAGLRRAAMPVVPEHQEFDEWCAARSRTPPANVAVHPFVARASSIPPPRPHKRQAPSSDPSRAKRSRASASSSSRIPSSTKAGMSSVNNSPAETARQSRREK